MEPKRGGGEERREEEEDGSVVPILFPSRHSRDQNRAQNINSGQNLHHHTRLSDVYHKRHHSQYSVYHCKRHKYLFFFKNSSIHIL